MDHKAVIGFSFPRISNNSADLGRVLSTEAEGSGRYAPYRAQPHSMITANYHGGEKIRILCSSGKNNI